MKIATPVILLAATLAVASPAMAKTSLSKGSQLCNDAIEKTHPKSARIDDDETRSSDTTLWFVLNVKKADGATAKFSCVVDRAAQTVQLTEK